MRDSRWIIRRVTANRKAVERREVSVASRPCGCGVNHNDPFVQCCTRVVYSVPLMCGSQYIGHTGKCLNVHLMKHSNSIKKDAQAHLSNHCNTCAIRCYPDFRKPKVLFAHKDTTAREVVEAYHIAKLGQMCVSQPSIVL